MTKEKLTARLDEIKSLVGDELFMRWKTHAERAYKSSPFLWLGAQAHHAFVYEEIIRRYEIYIRTFQTANPEQKIERGRYDNILNWNCGEE